MQYVFWNCIVSRNNLVYICIYFLAAETKFLHSYLFFDMFQTTSRDCVRSIMAYHTLSIHLRLGFPRGLVPSIFSLMILFISVPSAHQTCLIHSSLVLLTITVDQNHIFHNFHSVHVLIDFYFDIISNFWSWGL